VNDTKSGGTLSERAINNYQYSNGNNHFNIYGKTGYVFADNTYKSFGFQWSLSNYNNKAQYGSRNYKGNEKTGYFNFIYQSIIGSEVHKFRTGMSFVFDQFKETFLTNSYNRIEKVPGAFFEYTFAPFEEFSVIAGVRADKHNYYGLMLTPRIHFRYSPDESWVFRGVAGKGYRTSNIFTEFPSAFASSREVNIDAVENFGYGLKQEQAWNYGFNFMHYFYYEYREGTISVDLYRTNFIQSTIGDLDSNPQQINFSSVNNGAYSNSLQVELNMQPLENFDTRIAYRYMDVKQKIAGKMLERSFSSKNRALINLAYSTEKENVEDAQMVYDLTVQWFDKKRIPSTLSNPVEFRAKEYSPAFFLVNTQITRKFSMNFDVYLGIENLLDFRQKDIILDPFNPNSQYFDASLIWGPTNGRMVYAGFRFKM
ncbi:MAG: TonB-dependent receptor plug domain-containing protein, partial [Syntrophothermus sp.]